jgi:hypothetical protein
MKLRYRGVEYDYNPPSLEVQESEIYGRYRGRPTRFSYVSHVPIPQPVANLSYRGVRYSTTAQGQVVPQEQTAEQRQPLFQVLQTSDNSMRRARRALLREAASVHRNNIQRSLQHRLAVAKAQGNQLLIQQLEAEMQEIA